MKKFDCCLEYYYSTGETVQYSDVTQRIRRKLKGLKGKYVITRDGIGVEDNDIWGIWFRADRETLYAIAKKLDIDKDIVDQRIGTLVSNDSDKNWKKDSIQFPRLLAELVASGDVKISLKLCESMDLTRDQIEQIFNRAQTSWDKIKANIS